MFTSDDHIIKELVNYFSDRKNQESSDLVNWRKQSDYNEKLWNDLQDTSAFDRKIARYNAIDSHQELKQFHRLIAKRAKARRLRLVAATVTAAAILIGAILLIDKSVVPNAVPSLSEITSVTGCPLLVKADGHTVKLNDSQETDFRTIAAQSEPTSNINAPQRFNRVITPAGVQCRIILPDGTKVWINAASELKYPTEFSSDIREVELSGEAYFEVSHQVKAPFYIVTEQIKTHVTGTKFNVSAYGNDPNIHVTLSEGSVALENLDGSQRALLKPNQQYSFSRTDGTGEVIPVDASIYTAWKEGLFFFDNEPLIQIAKKLERWYGVAIHLTDKEVESYRFYGKIRQYERAEKVFNLIRQTGDIDYEFDGKTIILKTKN